MIYPMGGRLHFVSAILLHLSSTRLGLRIEVQVLFQSDFYEPGMYDAFERGTSTFDESGPAVYGWPYTEKHVP